MRAILNFIQQSEMDDCSSVRPAALGLLRVWQVALANKTLAKFDAEVADANGKVGRTS